MDEILTPEQWNELQGRIRKQHPELAEADLQYHEAVEQDMLAMVAFILRNSKAKVQEMIERNNRISPLKNYFRYSRKKRILLIAR